MLFQEQVHFLHTGAGTNGNAPLATGLDQPRVATLIPSHGLDHGLDALHVLFGPAEVDVTSHLAHAGHHL